MNNTRTKPNDTARIFAKLMFEGKVNAALNYLTASTDHGVLPATDDVINSLKAKHPEPAPIFNDILHNGPLEEVPNNYFDSIDELTIRKSAKMTRGAAGSSHFDSEQFRRILCSNNFKFEGKALREQIARFARKIASSLIDPNSLEAYMTSRLIPLNKNPGIRPIGIGETFAKDSRKNH